jgi:hypothetical protein
MKKEKVDALIKFIGLMGFINLIDPINESTHF